jgi:hypothetical protein
VGERALGHHRQLALASVDPTLIPPAPLTELARTDPSPLRRGRPGASASDQGIAPEGELKMSFIVHADRQTAVRYLAREYGTRGASRILRGLKPLGSCETPATPGYFIAPTGRAWRLRVGEEFNTRDKAEALARRIEIFAAYTAGVLRKPLTIGGVEVVSTAA